MIKQKARAAVKRALDRGTLVRPETCERCGRAPAPASDGRSCLHAHHHRGYDFPLAVEWLCVKCHFQEDKRPSGEDQGRAKLTLDQVAYIRRNYKADAKWWRPEGSAKLLGRQFGVSDRTIRRIVRGEIWIDAALK